MQRSGSVAMPPPGVAWKGRATLREAAPGLLLGLAAFGVAFHREIADAVQVWIASTAFSHCFAVLPLAGYLAWDRRQAIALYPVQPLAWVALAAVPLAVVWFAAERTGVMEGRQLVAICFVELLFLAVLGWRLWAGFSAALLYLFFLVPFGAFLVPDLQLFTTRFITVGLSILGVPYYSDAFTIEISGGTFLVAEACAGLRFLIAAIAFGVLYACLFYRSPLRRAAFIAACLVVPVVANGFRGLGIVLLGQLRGSAQAAAVDHVVYGWLFFSVVLVLMILTGLLFREDGTARPSVPVPVPPARPPAATIRRTVPAALAVVAGMAAGPALAVLLDGRAAGQAFSIAAPQFAAGPDCTPAAADVAPAAMLDLSHTATQRFDCHGITLTAVSKAFPPRANPAVLFVAARNTGEEGDSDEMQRSTLLNATEPRRWDLVETGGPVRLTATSLWIDGAAAPGGVATRLRQGWNSIFGSKHVPVLLAVTAGPVASPADRARARVELTRFLQSQSNLAAQIAGGSTNVGR